VTEDELFRAYGLGPPWVDAPDDGPAVVLVLVVEVAQGGDDDRLTAEATTDMTTDGTSSTRWIN